MSSQLYHLEDHKAKPSESGPRADLYSRREYVKDDQVVRRSSQTAIEERIFVCSSGGYTFFLIAFLYIDSILSS